MKRFGSVAPLPADEKKNPAGMRMAAKGTALRASESQRPVRAVESARIWVRRARTDVDRFVTELGWRVSHDAPARRALGDALVALRRLGRDRPAEVFRPYAEAAERIAAHELGRVPSHAPKAEIVEGVVVGTIVFETALAALRRLAHEHFSALRFETNSHSYSEGM